MKNNNNKQKRKCLCVLITPLIKRGKNVSNKKTLSYTNNLKEKNKQETNK